MRWGVLLAGGAGTRFWPLSTPDHPKQLLPLAGPRYGRRELKTPDEQKSTVRYSRHTLEIDEVPQHIAAGKVPTQLAMTWNDRVSFVLNETAQIRKLKLLDVVMDGVQEGGKDDDGFDTDAAILTGELSALIPDLLEALGGEMDQKAGAEPQRQAQPEATPA